MVVSIEAFNENVFVLEVLVVFIPKVLLVSSVVES